MVTILLTSGLGALALAVLAYGAGHRSGYYRGVSWGMHIAGREMMHISAHGEGCRVRLPLPDPSVLRPPRGRGGPN